MTTKKRETSKRGIKKLKLKKETIKNLDVRASNVKGGFGSVVCTGGCKTRI
jgi:hypothetical protein